MKITHRIHLVGSGRLGFCLTDDFDCHVYLLDGGNECALIDAGGGRDVPAILSRIEGDGLDLRKLRYLLLTHAHADHAGGAAELCERLNLRVVAHPTAARFVRDGDERGISLDVARQAGAYPADYRFRACPVHQEVREGDRITVGDLTLEVIETPGHCSGHVTYLLRRGPETSIFSGDTVFFGGRILLQNTWDCSLQDSIRSVEKLAGISPDGFFPGHLTFTLRDGRRQIEPAVEAIRALLPPPQLA